MSKKAPVYFHYPFTDSLVIENTRDTTGALTTILRINGEEVPITFEQGEALIRNSREVAEARENTILKKLEAECQCHEDDPFCWAAQAIDLIREDK